MLWSKPFVNWKNDFMGLSDSLAALERQWRKVAEAEVQAFRSLMVRLAYRLGAGDRLEALRKASPKALEHWTARDWEHFFEDVLTRPWNGSPEPEPEHNPKQVALPEHETPKPEVAEPVSNARPVLPHRVDLLQEWARALQEVDWEGGIRVPSLYRDVARSGGVRWKRGLMMVFLLARFGVNTRMEHVLILAQAFHRSPNTTRSWVRKAGSFMAQRGFLVEATLNGRPDVASSLAVYRLTSEGKDLARRLGWEPVESDWERLIRLHEGERFEKHTLGVLAAAMHARLRGYKVEVLPQVDSPTPPDLALDAERRVFVEVEISDKENPAKWRNNAEANGGLVALVAANPERRRPRLYRPPRRLKPSQFRPKQRMERICARNPV